MKRLEKIVSLIPEGSVIADIGCDHAYVTIGALLLGRAVFAYASDVREGPLSRAEDNIYEAGLSDKVVLELADGLDGAACYDPDVVIIAGMGGDLITRILARADFLQDGAMLILQPMTMPGGLRKYLLESGFGITEEHLAYEDGRIYQIIVCRYGDPVRPYTSAELLVGADHVEAELAPALYEKHIKKYETVAQGKRSAGLDASFEEAMIAEIRKKYEDVRAV